MTSATTRYEMSDRRRLSVQIDAQLDDEVRKLADDTGTKLSDAVRELLRIGLANFGRPRPRSRRTPGEGPPVSVSEIKAGIVDHPFGR